MTNEQSPFLVLSVQNDTLGFVCLRHCALIEVSSHVGPFQTFLFVDNSVCYQDESSEPSLENWERGKVEFLALNMHYKT